MVAANPGPHSNLPPTRVWNLTRFLFTFFCRQQQWPPPPRGVPLVSLWINKQKYKPAVILFSTSSMLLLLFVQFSFPSQLGWQGCGRGSLIFIPNCWCWFCPAGEKRRVQPCTAHSPAPSAYSALIFITKNSLPIERVWLIIAFNTCVSRLTLLFFSVFQHFAVGVFMFSGPFVCPCSIVFSIIRLRLTCFWLFNY